MRARLLLLPTPVVGSHALPGRLVLAGEAHAAGRLGPTDRQELIMVAGTRIVCQELAAGSGLGGECSS